MQCMIIAYDQSPDQNCHNDSQIVLEEGELQRSSSVQTHGNELQSSPSQKH